MTKIEDFTEIDIAPEKVSQYSWDVSNLPNHLPMSEHENSGED